LIRREAGVSTPAIANRNIAGFSPGCSFPVPCSLLFCYSHPNPVTTDKNSLYYGDNLDVLQRYVKDESVDLVYLDPPFNSRQDYNVLFAEKDGSQSS